MINMFDVYIYFERFERKVNILNNYKSLVKQSKSIHKTIWKRGSVIYMYYI